MTVTLDKRTADRLLRKYAKAQPTHIAQSRYTTISGENEDGSVAYVPECIVGQVLINDLSVAPVDISDTYEGASRILDTLGIKATKGAGDLLNVAQRYQDGRATYGEQEFLRGLDIAVGHEGDRQPWDVAYKAAAAYCKGRKEVEGTV